jgi:hypothetical protein
MKFWRTIESPRANLCFHFPHFGFSYFFLLPQVLHHWLWREAAGAAAAIQAISHGPAGLSLKNVKDYNEMRLH